MNKENENTPLNDGEAFWSQRYIDQRTGWDLGAVSEPLRTYIDQIEDKASKILIPGAGNAYEAEYLFRKGFSQVHVLDISELPLRSFRERLPDFPADQLMHGNFFEHEDQYDFIFEQTFFCSIPPIDNNRKKYARKMHELLKPGGKLVGVWFNFPFSGDLTKRPFGGLGEEYRSLFTPHFEFAVFEEAYNSMPGREGKELFGILKKKASI